MNATLLRAALTAARPARTIALAMADAMRGTLTVTPLKGSEK